MLGVEVDVKRSSVRSGVEVSTDLLTGAVELQDGFLATHFIIINFLRISQWPSS